MILARFHHLRRTHDPPASEGWPQLFTLLFIFAIIAALLYRPPWRPSSDAMGTARWADRPDCERAGMLSEAASAGLLLGRGLSGTPIWLPKNVVHSAIFAPTGAGKGVSLILPWLLTYRRGSCVVLDPKGENYRLTADRRRRMGQRIVRLDPFGVCGPGGDSFNPLDLIPAGPECVDEARAFAEAMVIRSPEGEKDPHWSDQAANVITALLTLVLMNLRGADRNLGSMRVVITDPGKPEKDGEKAAPSGLDGSAAILRTMGAPFDRLGGLLLALQDKERAGVLSSANRHTTFLDSPAIGPATSSSSFDARDLLRGDTTLYVILPPHQMEAQSRWLRLVIAALIRMVGQGGVEKGKEILFILDEAGQLGHMPPIEQGLTLLRGYGLKMAFFFQSLGQLKEVFRGKESVLLDNTAQVFFGTQSLETAERVSKMLGEFTNWTESASTNENTSWQRSGQPGGGGSTNVSRGGGRNWSVSGRALLKPDEVLNLDGAFLIAFVRGAPPVFARRVLFYRDVLFRAATRRGSSFLWWALLALALALVAWSQIGR